MIDLIGRDKRVLRGRATDEGTDVLEAGSAGGKSGLKVHRDSCGITKDQRVRSAAANDSSVDAPFRFERPTVVTTAPDELLYLRKAEQFGCRTASQTISQF